MKKILIIDDERSIRTAMSQIMEDEGYTALTAEDAIAGIDILSSENIDLVFLDVMLPKLGGIEALEKIKQHWKSLEVVIISGHASIDTAVKAVKLGAFDYLEKPLSIDKILTVCRNALEVMSLREENTILKKVQDKRYEIIGSSPQIEQVKSLINQAAKSDARILITGENGTGKELVAQAIHRLSSRSNAPFIEVNCAAIPDTLIESELFGHEKGAFTDASSRRKGRFELASGGTLFLDEIGDMSLKAQAKVLRAIQEQKIERVGSEKTVDIDVRIVAATNKNLEEACKTGTFREDLFFRLNVIKVHMPALRERPDDIMLLFRHFLKEEGAPPFIIDDAAANYLVNYTWPGNVRELKNISERTAILCDAECLNLDIIKSLFDNGNDAQSTSSQESSAGSTIEKIMDSTLLDKTYIQAKEMFEKYYLEYHLNKNEYSLSKTAQSLGIYPGNLHAKLKKYNIGRKS
ncbi:MAG: sigma-54 dependent transcriptional regulator [Spirochaetaceae bacterium]|jgi:two-component system nitrogen regulation response regulator NtrX|nr:sigma-54 dependent transcriptional regulator [Spirochaetaceae bacterium]